MGLPRNKESFEEEEEEEEEEAEEEEPRRSVRCGVATRRRAAAPSHRPAKLDLSVVAQMDKDMLKKQIENMKYQATMERWPLSKSIAA